MNQSGPQPKTGLLLGGQLRAIRKAKKMTQCDLARAMALGADGDRTVRLLESNGGSVGNFMKALAVLQREFYPVPPNANGHLYVLDASYKIVRILAPPNPLVGKLHCDMCELWNANEMIEKWHRHHSPVPGHRFSRKVNDDAGNDHGCVVLSIPRARETMLAHPRWIEAARCVTDGTPNACSMLYGEAARLSQRHGYEKVITYILEDEDGTSLRAAGWVEEGPAGGGEGWLSRSARRYDQPLGLKRRWAKVLR